MTNDPMPREGSRHIVNAMNEWGEAPTLQRARCGDDRVLLGVCGGIAHAIGVDPIVVRVITVVLAFTVGFMVVPAYFITGCVLSKGPRQGFPRQRVRRTTRGSLGWLLVAGGAFLLMRALDPWIDMRIVLGLAAVVIGINVLVRRDD